MGIKTIGRATVLFYSSQHSPFGGFGRVTWECTTERAVGVIAKLVFLPFSFLLLASLGFGGLWGARFGHFNGGLAFSVEQRLLQCPRPASGSCSSVTFGPTTKLVLAIGAKVLLPVAWDFALGFLGLFVAGCLSDAISTVSAIGHAFPILPFAALSIYFGLFALFFFLHTGFNGDHRDHHQHKSYREQTPHSYCCEYDAGL